MFQRQLLGPTETKELILRRVKGERVMRESKSFAFLPFARSPLPPGLI